MLGCNCRECDSVRVTYICHHCRQSDYICVNRKRVGNYYDIPKPKYCGVCMTNPNRKDTFELDRMEIAQEQAKIMERYNRNPPRSYMIR